MVLRRLDGGGRPAERQEEAGQAQAAGEYILARVRGEDAGVWEQSMRTGRGWA